MMNLIAPMQPNNATTENQTEIETLRICIATRSFLFFKVLPDLRKAKDGNTKSSGVKPIAPQMATKSPKNGIAAAIRVMRDM